MAGSFSPAAAGGLTLAWPIRPRRRRRSRPAPRRRGGRRSGQGGAPRSEAGGPSVLDVVRVRVVDVHRLAAKLGPHPERGGADTPQDLVGMVVPGERQPVLAQRRAVAPDGRATEAGQRRAAVGRVDGHPGEDLARRVDRRRDDVLGIDLAHGGPVGHGELRQAPTLPPSSSSGVLAGSARTMVSPQVGSPPGSPRTATTGAVAPDARCGIRWSCAHSAGTTSFRNGHKITSGLPAWRSGPCPRRTSGCAAGGPPAG